MGGEGVTKEGSGTVKKNMWRKKYAALVEFHGENGTCDVPADHPLAKWVQLQKRRFVKMQKNCPRKVKLLNEIGFDWGKQSATTTMTQSEKKKHHNVLFQKKLALLRAFKDEHGHCNVPADQPQLGRWVKSLRARHESGDLQKNQPEKVEKLNELGIEWKSKDDTTPVDGTAVKQSATTTMTPLDKKKQHDALFKKKLDLLCAFKDEHGHCNVPADQSELGRWVQFLRARHASGALQKNHPEKVEQLNELGIEWKSKDDTTPVDGTVAKCDFKQGRQERFPKKLALLHDFKDEHGNCNVPKNHPELGRWVQFLRARNASGGLKKKNPGLVDELDTLGFEWDVNDASKKNRRSSFEEKLDLLCAFKDEYGNCNVPPDHPELGHWVTSLRTRYASGLLQKKHPNVVVKLTALGFVWNHQKDVVTATLVQDTTLGKNSVRKNRGNGWDKKVRMLKEYKKKTGNSIPPKDHKLGPWVRLVNRKYRMIQKHYPELLEDLGDGTSSPSSSSASGGDGVSKNKKSLPFAKVN